MKTSIRSRKFTMGMILFMVIILLLCVSSAFYLNRLSGKTGAILKENHYSVIYAREMSEGLTIMNQEVMKCILTNKNVDISLINNEIGAFSKSFNSEKNNITEIGEGKLVTGIESSFIEYSGSIEDFIKSPKSTEKVIALQEVYNKLYVQLVNLSQINEKAIEGKTNDARISAKKALIQMSFIGAFCFLIAYGFTFSFSSYFNERFIQLYAGIKEVASSQYRQRLSFNGEDEISEIALIFNEMAENLCARNQKLEVALQEDAGINSNSIEDLKKILNQIRNIEVQTAQLILRKEKG